jgi:hypothetical protein
MLLLLKSNNAMQRVTVLHGCFACRYKGGMEARWLCRRWLCRNCGRPKTLIIEPNVGAGNPHQRAKRGACRNAEKCG